MGTPPRLIADRQVGVRNCRQPHLGESPQNVPDGHKNPRSIIKTCSAHRTIIDVTAAARPNGITLRVIFDRQRSPGQPAATRKGPHTDHLARQMAVDRSKTPGCSRQGAPLAQPSRPAFTCHRQRAVSASGATSTHVPAYTGTSPQFAMPHAVCGLTGDRRAAVWRSWLVLAFSLGVLGRIHHRSPCLAGDGRRLGTDLATGQGMICGVPKLTINRGQRTRHPCAGNWSLALGLERSE